MPKSHTWQANVNYREVSTRISPQVCHYAQVFMMMVYCKHQFDSKRLILLTRWRNCTTGVSLIMQASVALSGAANWRHQTIQYSVDGCHWTKQIFIMTTPPHCQSFPLLIGSVGELEELQVISLSRILIDSWGIHVESPIYDPVGEQGKAKRKHGYLKSFKGLVHSQLSSFILQGCWESLKERPPRTSGNSDWSCSGKM